MEDKEIFDLATENYLKTLYKLSLKQSSEIKMTSLKKSMGISASAASEMIKKLEEKKYISYTPYKGIRLLDKGAKRGQNMLRRHRIWELFLFETLGFEWHEVHNEAEHLEHASSDVLIDALDKQLGYPTTDPHGDPIPSRFGKMPKLQKMTPLTEAKVGCVYVVSRVVDYNAEFLQHINELGIRLNTKLEIIDVRLFDQSYKIKVEGKETNISVFTAKNIFVRTVRSNNEK